MNPVRLHQRGFAAIAAIFLVVILAALGGFMVSFSNTQQITSAQDVQGSRAYWAARAGLERGIAGLAASAGACPAPSPPASFPVDGFVVTVNWGCSAHSEAGANVVIYRVGARASMGAGASAIERSVSTSLEVAGP